MTTWFAGMYDDLCEEDDNQPKRRYIRRFRINSIGCDPENQTIVTSITVLETEPA